MDEHVEALLKNKKRLMDEAWKNTEEYKARADANDVYAFEKHMWSIGKRPDPDYKAEAPWCEIWSVWIDDLRTDHKDHVDCDQFLDHKWKSIY